MIVSRIKEIITVYNLTTSEFADKIGVPRSSMSHITSGRNKPSLDFVKKIKTAFPEIHTEWIIFGTGTMHSKEEIQIETINTEKNISESSSTPTLFELEDNPIARNDEQVQKTPKQEIKNPKILSEKEVWKVLFFYKDGTFEEFKKT